MLESVFNTAFRPATLLKKRLQHWCFPVKFAKFLRTPILRNIWERLLLTPIKFRLIWRLTMTSTKKVHINFIKCDIVIKFGQNVWKEASTELRLFLRIFMISSY